MKHRNEGVSHGHDCSSQIGRSSNREFRGMDEFIDTPELKPYADPTPLHEEPKSTPLKPLFYAETD